MSLTARISGADDGRQGEDIPLQTSLITDIVTDLQLYEHCVKV